MITGLIGFLLLLIVLLAIPITLKYQLSWRHAFDGYVKLQWAFGLVSVHLPMSRPEKFTIAGDDLAEKFEHFESSKRKSRNPWPAIRQKAFRRRIMRFAREIWRAIHKNNLYLRMHIGTGDPADTGQLWAIVGPIAGLFSNMKEVSIEIIPDFFDTRLELESGGNIRLVPLKFIYLTTTLMLSPAIWNGLLKIRVRE